MNFLTPDFLTVTPDDIQTVAKIDGDTFAASEVALVLKRNQERVKVDSELAIFDKIANVFRIKAAAGSDVLFKLW